MNALSADFTFSQHSLQDYQECPRRFELRYILRQSWPALQSEPVQEYERRAELGRRFHRLACQASLGVPADRLTLPANEPELAEWWQAFQQSAPVQALPPLRKPEFTMSAPFAGFRLLAKYDLLGIDPGQKAIIIDWKTSGRMPRPSVLADRLQTRVYLFLLVEAGKSLNQGVPWQPVQASMLYWYASAPENPIVLTYNPQRFTADREYLSGLVREIAARLPGHFEQTADEKKCRFCVYRSLCNRGTQAGALDSELEVVESWGGLDAPFDQIGEVEY